MQHMNPEDDRFKGGFSVLPSESSGSEVSTTKLTLDRHHKFLVSRLLVVENTLLKVGVLFSCTTESGPSSVARVFLTYACHFLHRSMKSCGRSEAAEAAAVKAPMTTRRMTHAYTNCLEDSSG